VRVRGQDVIVYHLRCKNSHEFEGWFKDSLAFDAQSKAGRVACPVCDSRKVEKAIMAPSVVGARKPTVTVGEAKKMRQFMTGLRKYVQENADYVGPKFAEEARKIHYGESEERHIYGEATLKEAKDLLDEGVDVSPLPPDLDSAN
jgi:hypothetical protein